MVSLETIRKRMVEGAWSLPNREPTAVVAICLLKGEQGIDVLFEVRAAHLKRQPGEVCLPGGHIEPGELARAAALRELSEELLVDSANIDLLGSLGHTEGPGGFKVEVLVALLKGYRGTYDAHEVDHTFTIPLDWFLSNKPDVYRCRFEPHMSAEFPWELVPGGKDYPFHEPEQDVCFYRQTEPLIWGFTARVMRDFSRAMRGTEPLEGFAPQL